MHKRTVLSLALAATVLAGWFFLFRPVFLGGPASYIIVSGTSMEPTMYTGDLVLLHKQERYEEGDAIAFSADGGAVIHRIVGGSDESGFVTQGDNRPVVDAWRPYPQHVLGSTWLRIPRAGMVVQHLQKPWLLGLVLGGSVGMSFVGTKRVMNRRGQRMERTRARSVMPAVRTFAMSSGVFAVTALLALVFLAAAVYGFTRPSTSLPAADQPSLTQRGDFQYTVHMDRSALYPSGVVASQDIAGAPPVLYRNLLTTLDLQFAYAVTGDASLATHGHYAARLLVAADRGWTKEFELVASTPFEGEAVEFTVPVDFQEVFALIATIEEETLYRASSYALTVIPSIQLAGEAAAQAVDAKFEPSFSMALSGAQFTLDAERSHVEELGLASNAGAAEEATSSRFTIPGGALPWASLGGAIASLIAGTTLGLVLIRRRAPRSECDQIKRRHRSLVIDGAAQSGWNPERRLTVEAFGDLRRIAEREGQLIVHQQLDDRCAYFVPMMNGVTAEFRS